MLCALPTLIAQTKKISMYSLFISGDFLFICISVLTSTEYFQVFCARMPCASSAHGKRQVRWGIALHSFERRKNDVFVAFVPNVCVHAWCSRTACTSPVHNTEKKACTITISGNYYFLFLYRSRSSSVFDFILFRFSSSLSSPCLSFLDMESLHIDFRFYIIFFPFHYLLSNTAPTHGIF